MNSRELREPPVCTARTASLVPREPHGARAAVHPAERCRRIGLAAGAAESVGAARRAVAETLREWRLPSLADDVTLCVSELVGNAVEHAAPHPEPPAGHGAAGHRRPPGHGPAGGGHHEIGVTLRAWPEWLFLEVTDGDPRPPAPPAAQVSPHELPAALPGFPLADRGRGLFLVNTLADATWWAPRARGGKSVFCRFDLTDRAV
ncbi:MULTISPECIES: ATP-binding protein [Streptomyces]|uniref:ATP-binding protein n=1 Tax=Streptomyces xinghaiensis TaxID=1038928 RepID=A0A3M8EXF8_9ACTN|nr:MULTISPECIES: ATP-binding protein [Streptomyces]PQM23524.1 ATP-binding protein [Streptomyces xinghaiensis]RKM92190.1 ATP-binding protein [Streptomyces xinghaiensis]RNC70161.1 ATP-binding protein [Streptomyces xinghaiensis]